MKRFGTVINGADFGFARATGGIGLAFRLPVQWTTETNEIAWDGLGFEKI